MIGYLLIIGFIVLLFFIKDYILSLLIFASLRLEGAEPNSQVLNSLRDDLVHERKKKTASLEMVLSSWAKGEDMSAHRKYFEDLIGQVQSILKDQRRNLLLFLLTPSYGPGLTVLWITSI